MRYIRTTHVDAGMRFYTAYVSRYWPAVFNASGIGDARFSPLHDSKSTIVPTLYGARTRTVALLETAFHEVHASGSRLISEAIDLAPRGLVQLRLPERATLIDLRDEALARLGLARHELVSALPFHYRCTREWAITLHSRGHVGGNLPVGLIWKSRMAELAQADSVLLDDLLDGATAEAFVLFGDRLPLDLAAYAPSNRREDLSASSARALVEQVALQLRATIVSR
jgi:RES domain